MNVNNKINRLIYLRDKVEEATTNRGLELIEKLSKEVVVSKDVNVEDIDICDASKSTDSFLIEQEKTRIIVRGCIQLVKKVV